MSEVPAAQRLERREGFPVVAQAGTTAEAIEAAHTYQPDRIVMDVRRSDGSGIEACPAIRAAPPQMRAVIPGCPA